MTLLSLFERTFLKASLYGRYHETSGSDSGIRCQRKILCDQPGKAVRENNDAKAYPEPIKGECGELARIVREQPETFTLFELFGHLNEICEGSEQPVVLMIDEVDSASDYQVFLDFLSQLRADYLDR